MASTVQQVDHTKGMVDQLLQNSTKQFYAINEAIILIQEIIYLFNVIIIYTFDESITYIFIELIIYIFNVIIIYTFDESITYIFIELIIYIFKKIIIYIFNELIIFIFNELLIYSTKKLFLLNQIVIKYIVNEMKTWKLKSGLYFE